MYKTPHSESTFVSADVEKLYATVAKSTFRSEHVKKLRVREHFSKFRCRKIVRHCGETYILKSKCTKHDVSWTTFVRADVEKMHAAVAKGTFGSQNLQNMWGSQHFWTC